MRQSRRAALARWVRVIAWPLGLASCVGCGARTSPFEFDAPAPANGGAPGAGGPLDPRVCVFDYDLTLSSHACPSAPTFCRVNACLTYTWYDQCLAESARQAVAECVRRGAFIGIASYSALEPCWSDKVAPIVTQEQFPELTRSQNYARRDSPWSYPALDDHASWNCDSCAYTMDGGVTKSEAIRRVMRHYGLSPERASERERVIFWDDTPANIVAVAYDMPEVRGVLVPRVETNGEVSGCGITQREIDIGWQ